MSPPTSRQQAIETERTAMQRVSILDRNDVKAEQVRLSRGTEAPNYPHRG
jgi:hypothetical protein